MAGPVQERNSPFRRVIRRVHGSHRRNLAIREELGRSAAEVGRLWREYSARRRC